MQVEPLALRPDRRVPAWLIRAWELLVPRFPRPVVRLVVGIMLRLPRGSRARRWLVLTVSAIGWEVTARTRFDLVLPMWDPACEWRWDATFRSLGFDEIYRGHEGVKRSLENWNEIWTERSFTLREVLDGGGTWVFRTRFSGRGVASGVPTHMDASSVVRLDPLMVDFRNFADDAEALREAGFAPAAQDAARGRR
jgi:hypothetical protein